MTVCEFRPPPTFDDGAPRLETFVFDFSGDLAAGDDVAFGDLAARKAKFDTLDALIKSRWMPMMPARILAKAAAQRTAPAQARFA